MKVLQVIERSGVYCLKKMYPVRICTYAECMMERCEYLLQDYRQTYALSYCKLENERRENKKNLECEK